MSERSNGRDRSPETEERKRKRDKESDSSEKKSKYDDDRRHHKDDSKSSRRDKERDSRRDREKERDSRGKDRDGRDKRDKDDRRSKDKDRESKRKEDDKTKKETTQQVPTVVEKKETKEEEEARKKRERLEAWKKAKENLGVPDIPASVPVPVTTDSKPETDSSVTTETPISTTTIQDKETTQTTTNGSAIGNVANKEPMEETATPMEEEQDSKAVEKAKKRALLGIDELEESDEESAPPTSAQAVTNNTAEDEIDPLDAFMADIEVKVQKDVKEVENKIAQLPSAKQVMKGMNGPNSGTTTSGSNLKKRYSDDEGNDDTNKNSDDDDGILVPKRLRKKDLTIIDHHNIEYKPFRKNFYIEVPEVSKMTKEEVEALREEDSIRVRGKDVPKPIKGFHQCGLSEKIFKVMEKLKYEKPTSIQCQAMPCVMSGRDVIGIAQTGSGKTLAFLLPMLRHILDQPPLELTDGPIGLVMAPTRELALQIYNEFNKFCKILNLRCVCVHGGTGVAQTIADLKRGAEIVVCTPGRMIDMLATNGGKVVNTRRVTFLVLDEADRMFDMGFEPQIMRIINNIRPDRQTVMFSATFPRHVETLAKKILQRPIEIVVGGRSVVCSDVEQLVEIIPEDQKYKRLMELVKEWSDKGLILIFIDTQAACDKMWTELFKQGYPCLSLHGGKDQQDRDFTIDEFKRKEKTIMVATSVAARGLDVKDLNLVINYEVPNHMEDYVHRVGRTGRAGKKGTAITFITPDEEKYAPDIIKAMENSNAPVPEPLQKLGHAYYEKKNSGTQVEGHGSGYGGKGFKFDVSEELKKQEERKLAAIAGGVEVTIESDSENEEVDEEGNLISKSTSTTTKETVVEQQAEIEPNILEVEPGVTVQFASTNIIQQALAQVSKMQAQLPNAGGNLRSNTQAAQARVAEIASALAKTKTIAASSDGFYDEIEINDFHQQARWKVTHKDALHAITEWTGASVTARGNYIPDGKKPGPGERKLYLFIEGPDAKSVKEAKDEIKRMISEALATAVPEKGTFGKFTM